MPSLRLREIISPALLLRVLESKLSRFRSAPVRSSRGRNTPCGSSRPSMDRCTCSMASPTRARESSVGVATSLLCAAAADRAGRYWQLAAAAVRTIPFALMNSPIASRYGSASHSNWTAWRARYGLSLPAPPRLQFCRTQLDMKPSASALIAAASVLIAAGSMAATRPHYGGTFRIAVQAALASLDPADSSQPDSFTRRSLSRLIFDTLVDQDDRGKPQPVIATSWEPEPGNQRWHFYLRSGISFHDGTAVNSDTVSASLRTANRDWKVFPTGDSVVIECASPDPWLPAELALARNGIAKREGGKLLGSGAFAINHWDPGKKLELSARDDYWRGRALVDSIEIEMGRNFREQMIELDLSKADVVEIAPEQAHRAVMEGRTVQSSASFELMALVFSREPQTPDEARQRQVLGLSIDRAAINSVLLQGSAEPTGALLPGWMTGYAFLFPSEADLSRARQLRSEIRYAPSWSLGYDASDQLARVIAERITLNARDAGLSVQLTNGGAADFRLVRIPLASLDAALALTKLAENLRLPQPKLTSDASSDLYAAETSLLESKRIIPLLHLKITTAAASTVKNWTTGRDGSWHVQDAWLATEKP